MSFVLGAAPFSEARCVSCHALVNPQAHGTSALAPRLVTPQSIEGVGSASDPVATPEPAVPRVSEAKIVEPKVSEDDAWRREVLERVRKRRQVRAHALPLFVEGQAVPSHVEASAVPTPGPVAPVDGPSAPASSASGLSYDDASPLDEIIEELPDVFENVAPLKPMPAPDLLASLGVPMGNASRRRSGRRSPAQPA